MSKGIQENGIPEEYSGTALVPAVIGGITVMVVLGAAVATMFGVFGPLEQVLKNHVCTIWLGIMAMEFASVVVRSAMAEDKIADARKSAPPTEAAGKSAFESVGQLFAATGHVAFWFGLGLAADVTVRTVTGPVKSMSESACTILCVCILVVSLLLQYARKRELAALNLPKTN